MGKRAKRARTLLKKMSILGEKLEPGLLKRYGLKATEDNSVMQERVKKEVPPPVVEEEKADVAPDTNFTSEIVKEMVEEVEMMVEELNTISLEEPVIEKPKPKPRRTRKPRISTRSRKKTSSEK
jgi:hypothetical protein